MNIYNNSKAICIGIWTGYDVNKQLGYKKIKLCLFTLYPVSHFWEGNWTLFVKFKMHMTSIFFHQKSTASLICYGRTG